MTLKGEYVPSPSAKARNHVEQILEAGTTDVATMMDRPVVLLTMLGISGKIRKVPLMRVEHDGRYAAVASQGGAPTHPKWYANLRKNPVLELMDGASTRTMRARELSGAERDEWWERCVAAYPPYADYQEKTTRQIPVFILEPVAD
ncbi:MAG TPA: nitroreductase family deazaflavin-dependent oxidoreductase [Propionibacterium sp.]|jgi:deazaflavin-dependent oxidoreductase (nitroreductase family)|nr:nitroreductase family deazaflavin-dependent oxidoreductase [Propionibacterium sp.]